MIELKRRGEIKQWFSRTVENNGDKNNIIFIEEDIFLHTNIIINNYKC